MSSELVLTQKTNMKLDSQRETVNLPDTSDNYSKEITVRVEGDSGPLLVIPIHVSLDVDTLNTGYLDVKIEVEPDNKTTCQPKLKPLIRHYERTKYPTKPEKKPFSCAICDKSFATRQHMERHSNLHSKQTLYPCSKCDKVLLDKSYLLRHLRTHSGERPYSCNICQKRFLTACSLRRHASIHNQMLRPYVCLECGKRFPDNSSLKKHIHLHSGVKTHVCSVCTKGFAHIGDLNVHMKSHNPVKQFRCDVCGKEFSRHNNLTRHKGIHKGVGNYKCDSCDVSYQHAGTLTRHIITCHPGKAKMKKTVLHAKSIESGQCSDEEQSLSSEDHYSPHISNFEENVYNIRSEQNTATGNTTVQPVDNVRPGKPLEIYKLDASGNLERVNYTQWP